MRREGCIENASGCVIARPRDPGGARSVGVPEADEKDGVGTVCHVILKLPQSISQVRY
jgi:hypothetical protein